MAFSRSLSLFFFERDRGVEDGFIRGLWLCKKLGKEIFFTL